MKHLLLIILSILLLSSPVIGQSDEKCYVVVESSKDIDPSLLSNISISLISKFVRDVEQLPPSGISLDSCQYQISVSKNNDTTFVTFKGEGLNSYGDSKLSGSDGFQQSILKSLYRSLKDKRDIICQDYGTLLDECNEVGVKYSGILFGTMGKTKWEDGGEWKWFKNDDDNRFGRYYGEIENGIPNGKGVVKTIDKQKYDGEWKNGRRHGKGIYIIPDSIEYEGEWKDGKTSGQGILTFNNGDKYVGGWKNGKKNGQGTLTSENKGTYSGEWKNGYPHGQLTSISPEGNKYIGEWENGRQHGIGKFISVDGVTMSGEFKNKEWWNVTIYDLNGNILGKYVNGVKQ